MNQEMLPRLWRDSNSTHTKALMEKCGIEPKEDGTFKIARSTACMWMHRAGAERGWYRNSYYTDMHERDDVVEDRIRYLRRCKHLSWRTAVWLQLRPNELNGLRRAHEEQGGVWRDVVKPHYYRVAAKHDAVSPEDAEFVEIHVDQIQDTRFRDRATTSVRWDSAVEKQKFIINTAGEVCSTCEFGHAEHVCKCHKEVYHIGQDESIYKAYALPKGIWIIDGKHGMRKKTDGPGEMVSGWQDEERGFGLPMTEVELMLVQDWQRQHGRKEEDIIKTSPGVEFLQYGKNKEGYWTFEHFLKQTMDVLDVLEALYPERQVVIEVDHSQGHAKLDPDALHAKSMGVKVGHGQRIPRKQTGSYITKGCLEPRGHTRGQPVVRESQVQHFYFREDDPPPHFEEKAYPDKSYVGLAKGMRQARFFTFRSNIQFQISAFG